MSNLFFLSLNRKLLFLVLSVSLIAIATTTILSSIFADEILRDFHEYEFAELSDNEMKQKYGYTIFEVRRKS